MNGSKRNSRISEKNSKFKVLLANSDRTLSTYRSQIWTSGSSTLKSQETLSYTKMKEKMKSETTLAVESMRSSLPTYSLVEIRQLRLPLHEALIMNLIEAGFGSSASYIDQLIRYQEEMLKVSVTEGIRQSQPKLINSRKQLMIIAESLKLSETYHNQNRLEDECEQFLKLAVHFAFGHRDWRWLGEELVIQSIQISSGYSSLKGRYEAISRYLYSKYLVRILGEYCTASDQLEIAKHLSVGKEWRSHKLLPGRGTVYNQVNELLYECQMYQVKLLMALCSYEEALQIVNAAIKSAAASCLLLSESRALYLKGICEIKLNDPLAATKSLLKAYGIEKRYGTIEGQCNIRNELATALMMQDRHDRAFSILAETKEDAEKYSLPLAVARSYKQIGTQMLLFKQYAKANALFKEAIRVCKEANLFTSEYCRTKNLHAISLGLQVLPEFVELVKNAGDPEKMRALTNWKNKREQFWVSPERYSVFGTDREFIMKGLRELMEKVDN